MLYKEKKNKKTKQIFIIFVLYIITMVQIKVNNVNLLIKKKVFIKTFFFLN